MPTSDRLLDRLRDELLIGDGAMGSYLHSKGIPLEAHFEYLNLVNEGLVRSVHEEYVAAGARVLETNTFAANRNKLSAGQLGDRTRDINLAGARLAKAACPPDGFVLGSVGPVGRSYLGEELDRAAVFREQIAALVEGGVDGLILETFASLAELKTAIRVARELADLPIVAQMAFSARRRPGAEMDPAHVARELEAAGADVIGVNCGPGGPAEALRVIRAMAGATDRPLSAFANASFPKYVEGRFIYVSNAAYFAETSAEIADAGANLIGGCCGTTPEHIRLTAERLRGRRPVPRRAERPGAVAKKTSPAKRKRPKLRAAISPPPNFMKANPYPVNVIVEVDPPHGLNISKALRVSHELKELGVNAVSIAENQLASVRMSSWVLSHFIQQEVGITAIAHCTCRDRNLIGQQSELMGACVLGINHVLAITGDPISLDTSGGTSVFDTNSFGLIDLLSRMNRGENLRGESISRPTEFVIGAGVNPNRRRMHGEIRRLEKKLALGATFAMTQPPGDADTIQELRERTKSLPIEVFVGLLPLVSARNAEFLHNEVPGITIAEEARRRMKDAKDPMKEGVAIAQEQIDAILEAGFRGIYIIPMLRKYEMAYELVRYIRSKDRAD